MTADRISASYNTLQYFPFMFVCHFTHLFSNPQVSGNMLIVCKDCDML